MECKHERILFARYFNPYDEIGHQYSGFFQNLVLDQKYPSLEVLQDIASININSYLYSEFSNRYVTDYWASFMHWDKEHKRYNIDPTFYEAFAYALCSRLDDAEYLYQLTQYDWDKIKDEIEKTKTYGEHAKTREHGDDVTIADAYEDKQRLSYAQQHSKTENDIKKRKTVVEDDIPKIKSVDTNSYGDMERDVTTENDKAAFNPDPVADYSADTKSRVHGKDVKARTDTLTKILEAHKDKRTTEEDPYKDQIDVTTDAHVDLITDEVAQRRTTDKFGNITDRSFEHIDTEKTESEKGFDPAKLLEIKKELANINAYKVVGDAIAATLLCNDWGWC